MDTLRELIAEEPADVRKKILESIVHDKGVSEEYKSELQALYNEDGTIRHRNERV